ncbi:MAG: hypothetical protein ACT4PW_08980 [Acidimicrobiia bacterium]
MTRLRFVAAAVGTSVLAACGGGPERLTREAFIARGDELCTRYNDTSSRLIAGIADEDSNEQGAESLTAAATVLGQAGLALRDHVSGLDLLVPPNEAEAPFEGARGLLRAAAQSLMDASASAGAGDLDRSQRSFESYTTAFDSAAGWARRYGFRACGRRIAVEEPEEAEAEGPPLPPAALAEFCDDLARFLDGLGNVPATASSAILEEVLTTLASQAAALADGPPPGSGSAIGEARATLRAVTKELAEHGFDIGEASAAGSDPLAALVSARGSLEVRVFGLGACATGS